MSEAKGNVNREGLTVGIQFESSKLSSQQSDDRPCDEGQVVDIGPGAVFYVTLEADQLLSVWYDVTTNPD